MPPDRIHDNLELSAYELYIQHLVRYVIECCFHRILMMPLVTRFRL